MNNQSILYTIIGVLAGVLIGIFVSSYAVNNNMTGMMRMMGLNGQYNRMMGNGFNLKVDQEVMGMSSSMDEMMESMEGKTGDEFDQAFLSAMMVHHQGAIDMARKVKANSKRPEILKMADDIVNAQTSEVEMMRQWQNEWYK